MIKVMKFHYINIDSVVKPRMYYLQYFKSIKLKILPTLTDLYWSKFSDRLNTFKHDTFATTRLWNISYNIRS